jgi:hypothetical protein
MNIRAEAAALAAELQNAEQMTEEQQRRFIALRSEMYVRGIYDPVLVRFDSITAPRATVKELAEELAVIGSQTPPSAVA